MENEDPSELPMDDLASSPVDVRGGGFAKGLDSVPTGLFLTATLAVLTLLVLGRAALDADPAIVGGWRPVEALTSYWYAADARAEALGHETTAPAAYSRPLWTLLVRSLLTNVHVSTSAATVLSLFGAMLALLFVVVIAPLRSGGPAAAVVGASALVLSPAFVGAARLPAPATLASAALVLLVLEGETYSKRKLWVLSLAAVILGGLVDFSVALVLPVLFVRLASRHRPLRELRGYRFGSFVLGALIVGALATLQGVRFGAIFSSFSFGADTVLILWASAFGVVTLAARLGAADDSARLARGAWFLGLFIALFRDEAAIETLAAIAPVGAVLIVYGFSAISNPNRIQLRDFSKQSTVLVTVLVCMALSITSLDERLASSAAIVATAGVGLLFLTPILRRSIGSIGVALLCATAVIVEAVPRWGGLFDPAHRTQAIAQREFSNVVLPTARVAGALAPSLVFDSDCVVVPFVQVDPDLPDEDAPTHLLGAQGAVPPRAFRRGHDSELLPVEEFRVMGLPIDLFRTTVGSVPRSAFEECAALAQQGSILEAEDRLITIIERNPGFASAWCRLADLRLRRGFPEFAYFAYLQAVDHDPARMAARLGLATIYERAGQIRGAVEHLERALEISPNDPWILQRLQRLR